MVKVQPTAEHDAAAPSRRSLVLKGHSGTVSCLAALDGDRLASSSGDGDPIIIWNLADSTHTTLEGHTGKVSCLVALDGDRLASSGCMDSIIIWNLTDGEKLARLDHGDWRDVYCLAALDSGLLASGGGGKHSEDYAIRIWSLTDYTQLAELKRHTGSVWRLAALDGDRLASGSHDESIIIWNLVAGKDTTSNVSCLVGIPTAVLNGHTGFIFSLAALDGDRLASGSRDNSVIIWNLADNTQLAKLEGHTGLGVTCLAAIDGGRLASGSWDKSIIIWNLADGSQLAKLEGHTGSVHCLAALAGAQLASGSDDKTIRVRPVVAEAIGRIVTCTSAFDFEETALGFREKNELGDLVTAALQQFDEKIGGLSASAAITTQASVFDAIAKVITADEDNTALVEGILGLVRDDDLLPDLKRRGVSDAAIEKLAPTALFRVVIDAKYATGPRLLLYVEFVSFLVVMLCFARVATFDVLDFSAPMLLATRAVEKTIALFVAFAVLAYFSVREVGQINAVRAIELAQPEDSLEGTEGLALFALLIPRLVVGFVACLLFLPVLLVWFGRECVVKSRVRQATSMIQYERRKAFERSTKAFEDWFEKTIYYPILHDPLTFLGLPRAWRGDYWNWIDAAALGCAWAAFARAATPGTNLSTDHAAATAMLLWLRLFSFLKNINQSLATFVLMFERIVRDLRVFMVFFLMIILAFGSAFYLYLGQHEAEYYGFHDDGPRSVSITSYMTFKSDIEQTSRRWRGVCEHQLHY